MLTFTLTRKSSSSRGTFGVLHVESDTGSCTLDTIEMRYPNREGGSFHGLCLPEGEYPLKVIRAQLDFEGEPKFYPWLDIAPVFGYKYMGLYSFNSNREMKSGLIQYGILNELGYMIGGYDACRALFNLIRPYLDASTYELKEPVKLVIKKAEDFDFTIAKRVVIEESKAFELSV